MSFDCEFSEHAFVIPYQNRVDPSPVGWSIWTFTDLDWALLSALPGKYYMNAYLAEDLEYSERLLAECWDHALTVL